MFRGEGAGSPFLFLITKTRTCPLCQALLPSLQGSGVRIIQKRGTIAREGEYLAPRKYQLDSNAKFDGDIDFAIKYDLNPRSVDVAGRSERTESKYAPPAKSRSLKDEKVKRQNQR